jgi:multidrug efflux pump subunit AcrA (membrane-fusion protein)
MGAAELRARQRLGQCRRGQQAGSRPGARHPRCNAQAQLHSLDAQVSEQQVQLHYYRVVAPRAGIVGDVPVRVGDRVVTTTMLTTVDRPGSLEAYIYVPIEKSSQLKMNLPVEIVDGAGKPWPPAASPSSRRRWIPRRKPCSPKRTIANSNDSLRTAQFIRARVVWGSQEKPVVPVVAVSRIGGLYFAFVAEPDQKGGYVVHQKPLQIGQIVGNDYVVLDGVKPGRQSGRLRHPVSNRWRTRSSAGKQQLGIQESSQTSSDK